MALFLFLIVIYRSLRIDPSEILTSLQKSDAGVASGTSRLKKKADELIGQSMLENFPVVKTIATRFPEIGKFCIDNPRMVPYVAQAFMGLLGGVAEKLPDEIKPLVQMFLGQVSTPSQQTQENRRSATGFQL